MHNVHNLKDEQLQRLKDVVAKQKKPWAILVAQVDPDALGSAFGLRLALTGLGVKHQDITIFYGGEIGHAQNKMLINRFGLLDAKFLSVSKCFDPAKFAVALVDSSQEVDGRFGQVELKPVIVIDHHRGATVSQTEDTFVWVEDIGAASTLIVELLVSLKVDIKEAERAVGPLLAVGIHNDTHGLTAGTTARDLAAFAHVHANIETQEFSRCCTFPRSPAHFDNKLRALERRKVKSACLVTNIGTVTNGDADDIATIADDFISCDGISLVVVWCIIGKKVRISARNTDATRDLGAFLRERFGPSCGAKVTDTGGGIGGGLLELDLGQWMIPEVREEIEALVDKFICAKMQA